MIVFAILFTVLAFVWTIAAIIARMIPPYHDKHLGRASVTAVWVVAFLFWLAYFAPAFGHDHRRPGLNDWMKGLFSKSKTWCCDGNDNDAIDEWETKDGRYRVKFRGEWFNVPESAIIDGPNEAGDALLWMNKGFSGFSVRCFMPGSLT